ncbi:MAG: SPOR domain-containing protein [Acidocella sp.]|nr:SPOR domain-containing protein [Acidocella sp.]
MEPEDDFLYRPQRERGQRLDPAIRRMALGAGGLSLLVIVVALGWSGIHAGGFGPPPVITAPTTALRVVPADPGGLEVPGANVPIMSGQTSSGAPQLAPAAAAPALALLNQAAGVNQPAPAPVPAPATAPGPVPAATPAAAVAASAAAPPPAKVSSGPIGVQLAATADEAGAQAVWAQLKKKFPDLLSGKSPDIIPAVVNGHSVWRLRLSGLGDADAAKAFCAKLTANGAACMVAAF